MGYLFLRGSCSRIINSCILKANFVQLQTIFNRTMLEFLIHNFLFGLRLRPSQVILNRKMCKHRMIKISKKKLYTMFQ